MHVSTCSLESFFVHVIMSIIMSTHLCIIEFIERVEKTHSINAMIVEFFYCQIYLINNRLGINYFEK